MTEGWNSGIVEQLVGGVRPIPNIPAFQHSIIPKVGLAVAVMSSFSKIAMR
jgi:hypothetical protein